MQELCGTVEEIIYANEDNGYAVVEVACEGQSTIAVGTMPFITPGEIVRLWGRWTTHHEYGEQFKVDRMEKAPPESLDMIQKYLGSGIIKGIRESTAQKIIEKFGDKTLQILEQTPQRLSEIKGISKKKSVEIGDSFYEQQEMRRVLMFLQQYGVTTNLAIKVYRQLGKGAIEQIQKNPYILSEKVDGIGFRTADKLAQTMGLDPHSDERIMAAILFVLESQLGAGNVYLPEENVTIETLRLIPVAEERIHHALRQLWMMKRVVLDKLGESHAVYLPSFYMAEVGVAQRLLSLVDSGQETNAFPVEQWLSEVETQENIKLAKKQRQAVLDALNSGVLVITGGPGTGKTTIIRTILHIFEQRGQDILLAAPTGRAAKRMTEMTGKEAKTVHRLLEMTYSKDRHTMVFGKCEQNPIECDVLIVDEMSMMDLLLMNALLRAIPKGTRLIMVGDVDQLPSVGAGNVLKDIIHSGAIRVVRLTEIFRQAEESMIVVNAHRIQQGEVPLLNHKEKDFFFMPRKDAKEVVDTILSLCKERLPQFLGEGGKENIQVLTPMRKSLIGVNCLNEQLQATLNPPSPQKKEKMMGELCFREGDKVMQIKNNYELLWHDIRSPDQTGLGVYNGDMGRIIKIDVQNGLMQVCFDDEREVHYPFELLDQLELAYAITVHKSQGSEYQAVVMPVFPSASSLLLNRNLFYTAVTRAKRLVVLVGQEGTIQSMVENVKENKRFSGLAKKLRNEE